MEIFSSNMFIDCIYNAKRTKYPLWDRIKFMLFLHKLSKVTPDFMMLWNIANFIRALTVIYFYPNTKENTLHCLSKYKEGENGFVLNVEKSRIVFTLFHSYKDETGYFIKIEIYPSNENKPRSTIIFKDGDAKIETIHDEQLFININDWLMNAVIALLKEYYNK